MHYALCIMNAISHCPTVGPAQTLCIMRFMHYELMHYEIVYCININIVRSETRLSAQLSWILGCHYRYFSLSCNPSTASCHSAKLERQSLCLLTYLLFLFCDLTKNWPGTVVCRQQLLHMGQAARSPCPPGSRSGDEFYFCCHWCAMSCDSFILRRSQLLPLAIGYLYLIPSKETTVHFD